MMKSKHFWIFGILVILIAGGCYTAATAGSSDRRAESDETTIAVHELPANVRKAALAAVKGLAIEEVDRSTENGIVVYDIEGSVGDQEYELEVTAAGKVIEIERDDDDDDAEEGDDEDDDGDDD